MVISKMRFKGYSWVYNPKTINITKEQILSEQIIPFESSQVQDLGVKCRIINGTGVLMGEDCLEQYKKLLELQSKNGSGILSLPNMRPFYAFFKKLELACDPTPKEVTYKYTFVEDVSKGNKKLSPVYHSVSKPDETLWDISYEYNIEMDDLVKLNPQIMRIDELEVNQRVRVC